MSDDTPKADEIVEGVLAGWRRDQQLPTEVHTLAREFLDGDDDAREPLAQELAKLRTPIEGVHAHQRRDFLVQPAGARVSLPGHAAGARGSHARASARGVRRGCHL